MQRLFEDIFRETATNGDKAARKSKILGTLLQMFGDNKDKEFSLNEIEKKIADEQIAVEPRADVMLILETLIQNGDIKKMDSEVDRYQYITYNSEQPL